MEAGSDSQAVDPWQLLVSLAERDPGLKQRLAQVCGWEDGRGDLGALAAMLAPLLRDEPALTPLAIAVTRQVVANQGWRDSLAVCKRIDAKEPVPLEEACDAYLAVVEALKVCEDAPGELLDGTPRLMAGMWPLVAESIGSCLAGHAERLGVDSTPLHAARRDSSLRNALAAAAAVDRLAILAEASRELGVAPSPVAAINDPSVIGRTAEPMAGKVAQTSPGLGNTVTLPTTSEQPASPALSPSESRVLRTMARFDSSRLLLVETIAEAMEPAERRSEETVRTCVRKLIAAGCAERPEGDRSGARLTIPGRRLAGKIAD